LTGGSEGEAESIASNGDGGDEENGMDEEDNDAEVVEEEANHSTIHPNHSSNLL
jgi:hypothetical protein